VLEPAGEVTGDVELRVDDQVDVALLAGQLHHDRVDQERHVVGDDLDHRVTALPAVLLDRRRAHPDQWPALRSLLGKAIVAQGRAEDVDRITLENILRRDVAVVLAEEVPHVAGQAGRARVGADVGGLVEQSVQDLGGHRGGQRPVLRASALPREGRRCPRHDTSPKMLVAAGIGDRAAAEGWQMHRPSVRTGAFGISRHGTGVHDGRQHVFSNIRLGM